MASDQTKQKMMQAKQLIQAKRYLEARKLLETVKHPTATKWLAKLDDIELGDPFAGSAPMRSVPTADELPDFRYLLRRDVISLILFPLSLLWITRDARMAEKAVKAYGAENVPGARAVIRFNRLTYYLIVLLPMLCLLIAVLTRP